MVVVVFFFSYFFSQRLLKTDKRSAQWFLVFPDVGSRQGEELDGKLLNEAPNLQVERNEIKRK